MALVHTMLLVALLGEMKDLLALALVVAQQPMVVVMEIMLLEDVWMVIQQETIIATMAVMLILEYVV
jgi:hypothetical protein